MLWATLGALAGLALRKVKNAAQTLFLGDCDMVDRRSKARLTENAAQYVRKRDPNTVNAVVLHQMGFSRGSDPSKYDRVTAQYTILPDGTITWLHDWSKRLPASNGLNSYSIAIEFAGNFPSRSMSDQDQHYYKPEKFGKNWLTQSQIDAGRCLLTYLNKRGVTKVFGHVQSSGSRGIDPGPDIWFNVGQWAIVHLGMDDGGPGFSVGSGKPIPDYWRQGPGVVA